MHLSSLPSWLTELPVAHRGLHGADIPENSLESFKAASDKNVAIELDLQLTVDGEMIAFHDTNLERMTGKRAAVANRTYQSIRRHPLANGERIPCLTHVLEAVKSSVPLLIELKPGRHHRLRAERTAEVLAGYRGAVAVQSFDPRIVTWFQKNTSLPAGQIMGRYKDPDLDKSLRRRLERMWLEEVKAPDFIAFDLKKLTPEISDSIRGRMPLLTWTVKDERKLKQAEVLADNFIFENVFPG